MNVVIKGLGLLVMVVGLSACTAPMQWWRVGNCVVIYETRNETRQIVAAGQQCDIKQQELPNLHGRVR